MQIKEILSHDALIFFKKFVKNPLDVGSITPSSKGLAKEITRYIGEGNRYLEAGPGTGVFTGEIISKLNPGDKLDLVELDPHFCVRLREKYHLNPQVEIFEGSITDWNPEYHYDVIISSLPINALKKSVVEQILLQYKKLVKKGGRVSYFEYLALPELKKRLLISQAKEEYQETLKILREFVDTYEIDSSKVWSNLPPARVHHCVVS